MIEGATLWVPSPVYGGRNSRHGNREATRCGSEFKARSPQTAGFASNVSARQGGGARTQKFERLLLLHLYPRVLDDARPLVVFGAHEPGEFGGRCAGGGVKFDLREF